MFVENILSQQLQYCWQNFRSFISNRCTKWHTCIPKVCAQCCLHRNIFHGDKTLAYIVFMVYLSFISSWCPCFSFYGPALSLERRIWTKLNYISWILRPILDLFNKKLSINKGQFRVNLEFDGKQFYLTLELYCWLFLLRCFKQFYNIVLNKEWKIQIIWIIIGFLEQRILSCFSGK